MTKRFQVAFKVDTEAFDNNAPHIEIDRKPVTTCSATSAKAIAVFDGDLGRG